MSIFKLFNKKNKSEVFGELSDGALEKLLSSQDPGDLSLLTLVLSQDEMGRVFEVLPVHTSTLVSIARSRHHRLTQGILKEQADVFLKMIQLKVGELKTAKAGAQMKVKAALSAIDFEYEFTMAEKLEKEMPELKNILEEQGYFETTKKIQKGVFS